LADQDVWRRRNEHRHAPSPLRGVSTQEVLEALGSAFSPLELDWELVGVVFVQATSHPIEPAQPVELTFQPPPWAGEEEPALADVPEPARMAPGSTPPTPRKWLPEHDEIMAAVRDLSWEGYRTLIADMFRHDGYEVFEGEGPDSDVIDMEVIRGGERKLVNCQLRGLDEIGTEPLSEMAGVGLRNGADGVFVITDGAFTTEAWSLADGRALVLIDRDTLLGLVLDFTLGASRERSLKAQVRRFLTALQPGANQWAS
jgi:hypothetical protein